MKRIALAFAAASFFAGAGMAMATPGGSSEDQNQVTCGGTDVAEGVSVAANSSGVEACDDAGAGIQGRVIVDAGAGYASIDGDADNSPDQLDGWARIDSSGPSCGPDGGGDSSAGGGSLANCG